MAAVAFLTSLARMRGYLGEHTSWRRASVVRRALELASEDSRSPNETRLRLIYQLDADLPPPLVNQPVWDGQGNLLGIADLLDPVAGLVGEFDGADHRSAGRQMRDIGRQEKFERCGLVVFRVTGLDLARPRQVVDRIHFRRSRALWLPADRRAWTIDPPDGWPVEQTVDEYLAEREALLEQVRVGA